MAVYYKSVNCNPLTPLLRFVVDLLYNLYFLQLTRSRLTVRRAIRLRQQSLLLLMRVVLPVVGLGWTFDRRTSFSFLHFFIWFRAEDYADLCQLLSAL